MIPLVCAWLIALAVVGARLLARTDDQAAVAAALVLALGWLALAHL